MSAGQTEIDCRNCRETFPLEAQSCPHCGTTVRNDRKSIIAIGIGIVIVLAGLADVGALWPFMLVGLLAVVIGGYMIKDKRDRMQ